MNEKDMEQAGREVAKRKWVDRGSPVIGDNGLILDEGDNRKYMSIGLELYNMDKVDLIDPKAVKERIAEYFRLYGEADVKPTVTGLGMALGVDRRRLWEIATGNNHRPNGEYTNLPRESADAIKKAYDFLGNLWENYMQNGKINPVSGIFLGKNNFGYQDKQEMVLTPNNPESDFDAKDIADRYSLPEATSED